MDKYKIDKKSLALALMLVLTIVISLLFVNFNIFKDSKELYGYKEDVVGQSISSTNSLNTNSLNSQQTINLDKCQNYIYLEYLPPLPRSNFSEASFNNYLARIQPYEQYIKEASALYNIPEELMIGIMRIESGGRIYHSKTVTVKDGKNSKIKVETLCNGRCRICKFAGGPGNEYNCLEDLKKCNYYDQENRQWTISSSTGYCSISQTSIAGCKATDTCNVNEFLKGNPKDAIYNSAANLRSKIKAYSQFVSTPPYDKIPDHNLYWAVAFAYNNGQGSMRTAFKELIKLKYNNDPSKFNWWEITPEDFLVTKDAFANSIKNKIEKANGTGRTGYPLTVLKAMKLQGFDGCNAGVIIGEQGLLQYLGKEKYNELQAEQLQTQQTTPIDLAQIELKDKFIYQINPSFYVPLTHKLDIYTKLREKAFLIAKEVEKCHEQKNIGTDGAKLSAVNKTIIEECITQEINKNKNINLPPQLTLEICDKDINKASYAICAKSNNKISVFTGTRVNDISLTYKFALGFNKPSLKNVNIETIQSIKEEIKNIPGAKDTIQSGAISFSQKEHNSKEVDIITLDINKFDIKIMSASSVLGKQKASLKDMIEATGAIAGITGGFFNVNKEVNGEVCSRPTERGAPLGLMIENSNMVSEMFNMDWDCHLMQKGIIDPNHILISDKDNMLIKSRDEYLQIYNSNNPQYALQSGALIYNGQEQKCPFDDSGFCSPSLKRSIVCITKDDKLKLMVFKSLSLTNLPSWVKEECKDLINLDGGGSTSMEFNVGNEFHSIQLESKKEHHFTEPTTIDDGRSIVNAILVFPKAIESDVLIEGTAQSGTGDQQSQTSLTIPAQLTQITEKIPEGIKFYTYTTKCSSNKPNEQDRVEAIIIPEGISSTPDIYFYFHGMHSYSDYLDLLVNYNCLSKGICNNMKEVTEKGENAIMIMFSGSKDSSNYGEWMNNNFKCFYDEAISTINSMNLQPKNMQLMGHSGGGKAIKNIVETFIGKEQHLPLKAAIYYDACYTWCNSIKNILKQQGAKLYSSVTLISGGNIPPRKSDFKALTGIDIDSAVPNMVYSGIGNDQDIKVVYMKNLNHGVIPNQCFYNFLNEGVCVS